MLSTKKLFKFCILFFSMAFLSTIAKAQNTNDTQPQQNQQTASNAENQSSNKGIGRIDYGQLLDESPNKETKSYEDTLYKVVIDTFEEGGNWMANVPMDVGLVTLLQRKGVPLALKNEKDTTAKEVNPAQNTAIPAGRNSDLNPSSYFVNEPDPKQYILGVKTNFFGNRQVSWLRIDAISPTKLTGIVKGFEVWVTGRNVNHTLYILVEDVNGKEQAIEVGTLNFSGWRKLTVQVPSYIAQENPRLTAEEGLTFKGFGVKFNLLESYGNYFIYFDNLAAEVSRYKQENLNLDDPRDNW